MFDRTKIDRSMELINGISPKCLAYRIKNRANGDSWETILVAYNGSSTGTEVNANGKWEIVANREKAGVQTLATAIDSIRVEPFSLIVAHSP
jgi:pullulanase